MNRQGLQKNFDLFGVELLNIIASGSDNDYHTIRNELGYSQGSGFGVDTGFEYSWSTANSQFNVGVSWLDIGDTRFRLTSGTRQVPKQDSSLNMGVASPLNGFLPGCFFHISYLYKRWESTTVSAIPNRNATVEGMNTFTMSSMMIILL